MTVKVKTIAIAGLIFILMMIAAVMVVPGFLLKMEKYDTLLAWFPKSQEAPEALYWSAVEAGERGNPFNPMMDRVQVFPNSSSYVPNSSSFSQSQASYAIHQWERLLSEYPDYRHAEQAKINLASIYFALRNWPQAERLYEELAASSEQDWTRREAESYLQALQSRQPRSGEEPSLTGRVIVGGKGVEDVLVILREHESNTHYSNPFGYYPVAMTDQEGIYRFYDLDPDDYEVGVGIGKEMINGFYRNGQEKSHISIRDGSTARYDVAFVPKVETVSPVNRESIDGETIRFEWQPYPGASYYSLGITALERDRQGKITGNTSSTWLNEKWEGTSAEYELETLRTYPRGISVSMSQDEEWISAQSILGAVFPGGEFTWYVDAFDSEDRKISSSSGYFSQHDSSVPFFIVSDQKQLKGDRYVIQQKYEEAVEAYEKQLDDPYALRALGILWTIGFRYGEAGDKAKALSYLERLPNPSRYDYEQMARLNEELGNLEEKERIMQELEASEAEREE
ncbi:tetratricopeptide repeat protein [Paenibacillus sp. J2TS4]|uniref:tetratricopeptide repeat protein n=1 Tax=Paenibacillus sp. J2TS4 TaxID=2807194 RepID=UPI001B1CED53|nr:tetratricopeptide repeat protein [Paenibacillus sp. J2TS4]GIP34015.1 hypothetical protein J2TS4_32250 [Paenibacillus sp. J2TS4]